MEFFATCPKGFEQLLSDELVSLGTTQVRPLKGQVAFGGELRAAYRVCLWSRLASRVMLVLARIDATSSDTLYEGLSTIAWEDHLTPGATLVIDAHGTNDALRNTQYVAQRSKDAVSDRMVSKRGTKPQVDTINPDVTIAVRISDDRATVALDLSGAPLFRRGYEAARTDRAPVAPLRSDYASALLAAGGWFRDVRHGDPTLVSMYSGAGNVLVEAAGLALDHAPGLLRARWGFERWAGHVAGSWQYLVRDAEKRAQAGAENPCTLIACDPRRGSEREMRQSLRSAGLNVEPQFVPAEEAASLLDDGLVTVDLSWLGQDDLANEATALSVIGQVAGMRAVAIAPSSTVDVAMGVSPAETVDVLVGSRDETIRRYDAALEKPEQSFVELPAGGRIPVLVSTSDQFALRLSKVSKLRSKWAEDEDVTCYRVYDADLPDYAVTIDLYEGSLTPGRWLQISEYAAPKEIDEDLAHKRLLDVLAIAPQVMGIAPENVSLRVRDHSVGGSQYADEGERGRDGRGGRGGRDGRDRRPRPGEIELPFGAHLVDEGGLTFEVNFTDRLDCGIFLDHRDTRAMIRELMKQTMGSKRFLNLFAYTGTATCYAADGGAKYTTTVDMSRPSLAWARRNMERNGFDSRDNEYVQADVLGWVDEQRRTKNRWDLIFCDVPTFSNSKNMRSGTWDVQRDHAELIIGISRLLTRNGSAIFSCNLRSFKPDVEKLEHAGVKIEDITEKTIPEDFSRNPKVHHTFLVTRTPLPESSYEKQESHDDRRPAGRGGYGGHGTTGRGGYQGRGGHGGPGRSDDRRGGYGNRDHSSQRDDRGGDRSHGGDRPNGGGYSHEGGSRPQGGSRPSGGGYSHDGGSRPQGGGRPNGGGYSHDGGSRPQGGGRPNGGGYSHEGGSRPQGGGRPSGAGRPNGSGYSHGGGSRPQGGGRPNGGGYSHGGGSRPQGGGHSSGGGYSHGGGRSGGRGSNPQH